MPPHPQVKRVLIIGAGCTGACAAVSLRQLLGPRIGIEVWEKARGPGGRMTTTRQELGQQTVRADVGAQYFSVDISDPNSQALLEVLVQRKAVAEVDTALLSSSPERPKGDAWRHYAGVDGGLSSALKCLLEEADATLHAERRVAAIDPQGDKWRVRPFDGAPEAFDAVLVAIPGCGPGGDNLNKIRGGWEALIDRDCDRLLRTPEHDHRFSVVLFLNPRYAAHCDQV